MERRDLFKITAGAALAGAARAQEHNFFTADEFKLVDELTEMIIPADEKSGGARAAKVAEYIDFRLSEAFDPSERDRWRQGLKRIDELSSEMHGAAFLKTSPAQRLALVTRIASHEEHPQKPEEKFFGIVKNRTVGAYYTSKIGIHDDLDYKGNVYQSGDYAGDLP